MDIKSIIDAITAHSKATGTPVSAICRAATGNPRLMQRLQNRLALTERDAKRVADYIARAGK